MMIDLIFMLPIFIFACVLIGKVIYEIWKI